MDISIDYYYNICVLYTTSELVPPMSYKDQLKKRNI